NVRTLSMSRTVILIELTCPAEEGIEAAQIRKETRYHELLEQINDTKTWKARLMTVEVGARGLVGTSTFRAFRVLGLTTPQTKTLVKSLSELLLVVLMQFTSHTIHPCGPIMKIWLQRTERP